MHKIVNIAINKKKLPKCLTYYFQFDILLVLSTKKHLKKLKKTRNLKK